jgi:hypothetical protein
MRNMDIADTREKLVMYTETGMLRAAKSNGVPQLPSGATDSAGK